MLLAQELSLFDIIVLMLFMGLRSATIIGFVLVVTIAATFIFMLSNNVSLERISLGALILALGMLVDNAIVIVENIYRYLEEGWDRKVAAKKATGEVAMPVIAATMTSRLTTSISPASTRSRVS